MTSPAALIDARAALDLAERAAIPTLIAVALCPRRIGRNVDGAVTPGLLERGAELEERHGLPLESSKAHGWRLPDSMMRLGQIDRAGDLEDLTANAEARGDERSRARLL